MEQQGCTHQEEERASSFRKKRLIMGLNFSAGVNTLKGNCNKEMEGVRSKMRVVRPRKRFPVPSSVQ